MRIAFVGAGAVGGYFGSRIAEAGLEVAFVLRPESARVLRARGLSLRSPLGHVVLPSPNVLDGTEPAPPLDVMFFACKAEHVGAAAELARPLAGPHTIAIPLQNGVDAPATLCRVLGPERVLGGLSRIFAERVSPGNILHMGLRPSISCGEREGGVSPRVRRVVGALASVAGMSIDASEDIWTEMWKKLLMVCSIGIVGAVARAPLGVLLNVPETRGLLRAAGEEIAAVARAHGAAIPKGYTAQQMGLYGKLPADTTASMHRDLERGDPSELDGQLGAARRYGREGDVATPILDALYGALCPGELRARGSLDYENIGPKTGS